MRLAYHPFVQRDVDRALEHYGAISDGLADDFWDELKGALVATGSIIPVNISSSLKAPAGNGTYLPHVVYTQFLSERFAITMGKIDTGVGDPNAFAHGVGQRGFMNTFRNANPLARGHQARRT